jgi:hypothetical protein
MATKYTRPESFDEAVDLLESIPQTTFNHLVTKMRQATMRLDSKGPSTWDYEKENIDRSLVHAFNLITNNGTGDGFLTIGYIRDNGNYLTKDDIAASKKAVNQWFKTKFKRKHLRDCPNLSQYVNQFADAELRKINRKPSTGSRPKPTKKRQPKAPHPKSRTYHQAVKPRSQGNESPSTTWFWLMMIGLFFAVTLVDSNIPHADLISIAATIGAALLYWYVSGHTVITWQRYCLFIIPVIGLDFHFGISLLVILAMIPAIRGGVLGLLQKRR